MLSTTEIRVLDLLPREPHEHEQGEQAHIRCRTRVVPISSDADYETVSYVWGDPSNTSLIEVDGKNVAITKNLEAALRRIRLLETRTLWIDQICINQDDNIEKANQIPLMRQIYSKTKQCLLWFGEIRSDIQLSDASSALDVIHFLNDFNEDSPVDIGVSYSSISEQTLPNIMKALRSIALLENPWWHRVWTLQEAILPSKASMLWGPLTISWETILDAGQNYVSQPVPEMFWPYIDILNRLFGQTNGLIHSKNGSEGPLYSAYRWSFRGATNPLDKIYGILGLFPSGTLPRSECVDYQLQPASLFAMATADLIENTKSLHPISLVYATGVPENTPNIPSWACDFAVGGGQHQLAVDGDGASWYLIHAYYQYRACGNKEIDWELFRFDPNYNTLTLSGYMVDEVTITGTKLQSDVPGTTGVSYQSAISYINDWYRTAEEFYQGREYPQDSTGPENWSDSFWRGLLGGTIINYEFIPEREAQQEDIALAKEFVRTGQKDEEVCYSIFANMCHRIMFITKTGLLGFGANDMAIGDQVWVLDGGNWPFILRPSSGSPVPGSHHWVGSSYVHGIMGGEAATETHKSKSVCLI
ncbi:heterokaryon incompatibility protein-domain-containing protein [Hypoxylon rubiginosum]|uniref:Heterokaryon incompatibility protein-domain-containing protein n=1 Tax=Hypoxylon rubiginosum TaxID=110542 RepID=A0ACB9Z2I9_9PEZI|nr:heterokaryon incompatibility protein-domain-containing protein [Hypoxylon rubiginosum]